MNRTHSAPIARSTEHGPGFASRTMAGFIFASRWLQAPLYLGLIIAQAVYVVLFFVELWHLLENILITGHVTEADVMLSVLGLIDIVMIANLLIMVIIGGYETFVSKIRVQGHHDEPEWLSHVNTNLLKIKLAVSIISISSIHLLKTFIEVGRMDQNGLVFDAKGEILYSSQGVFWEVMIHIAFIISALALAWIDKLSHHAPPQQSKQVTEVPVDEAAPMANDSDYVTVRMPAGAKLPEGAEIVSESQNR